MNSNKSASNENLPIYHSSSENDVVINTRFPQQQQQKQLTKRCKAISSWPLHQCWTSVSLLLLFLLFGYFWILLCVKRMKLNIVYNGVCDYVSIKRIFIKRRRLSWGFLNHLHFSLSFENRFMSNAKQITFVTLHFLFSLIFFFGLSYIAPRRSMDHFFYFMLCFFCCFFLRFKL